MKGIGQGLLRRKTAKRKPGAMAGLGSFQVTAAQAA
jgi:hypothetical protein